MKKILMAVIITFSTTSVAQAQCGIDCWLSNTFSSQDFVGDWLKDTFGPVHNGGSDGKDLRKDEALLESYKKANDIASNWKVGKSLKDRLSKSKITPVCSLEKLLYTVNKEQKAEVLLEKCFISK